MSGDPTPRYTIVAGGEPTPEELAAIAVALTPVVVEPDEDTTDRTPAWTRAGLREAVGERMVVSADDLATSVPVFP